MISLRFALPLVVVIATMIPLIISHLILLPRQEQRTDLMAQETLRHEITRLQESVEILARDTGPEQVRTAFGAVGTLEGLQSALLVDDTGTIVAASALELIGQPWRNGLSSPLVERIESMAPRRGLVLQPLENHTLLGYAPICGWSTDSMREDRCGFLVLHITYRLAWEQATLFYHEQLFAFAAASGVGALLLFAILHFGLTMRLGYLNSVITRFQAGNLWVRPSLSGNDEVAQLSAELSDMLDTVAENDANLRKVIRVIEQSPSAVTIVDAEGRIEYANHAALARYGALSVEVGRQAPLFDYAADDDRVQQALSRALAMGDDWDGELQRRVDKNGEPVWDRVTVHPLRDERGLITNFIISETDVTEFKRASAARTNLERQLRHVQKMETLGRLAGGVAHDFNNILTPISGYAQMVLDSTDPEDKNHRRLERILNGVRRARDLVGQLLVVSRKGEQDLIPVDLAGPVREAVDLMRASATADLRVEFYADPGLWPVLADPSRIHQVVMNLCTNAGQAIGQRPGLISVALENMIHDASNDPPDWQGGAGVSSGVAVLSSGRYVRLTIEDNGPGMSPDIAERIFEPFFTTKKAEGGSGMGLSIVDGIVSQLGGRITVYSEPGLGTAFRIYLPAADTGISSSDPDLTPAPTSPPSLPVGQGECLLLVDDEPENLAALGEYLTNCGYRVKAIADPLIALATVKTAPHDFDLLITDFAMPGLQGDQLALAVKTWRPTMPVVMISGFSSKVTRWNREVFGVDAFVPKPIELPLLRQTLYDLLHPPTTP